MIIKGTIVQPFPGLISPDNNYSLIPILKNGSMWTRGYLIKGWGWEECIDRTQLLNPNFKILTVLRDPLSRWYTAIAQFFVDMNLPITEQYFEDEKVIFELFQRVKLDYHQELQSNFLEGVDTNKCVFFRMDEDFEQNFKKYCHTNLGGLYMGQTKKNQAFCSEIKLLVISKLKNLVENNPDLKHKILTYYEKDYELINSVEFYGKKSN